MAQLARSLGQLLHGLVLLLLAMEAAFAKDYYSVLGVDRSADDATLKRAYRALARYTPIKSQPWERFPAQLLSWFSFSCWNRCLCARLQQMAPGQEPWEGV